MNLYDLTAHKIDGQPVSLSEYKGKVLLIVNTASQCGFTPQFEGLQTLYEKYHKDGLEILGFPTNQFGNQDPGTNQEIESFCQLNYGVTFPMFDKIEVNGKNTHPIYKFLKSQKGSVLGKAIKWNFTKFLVDSHGNVIRRYGSNVEPYKIENDIKELLNELLKKTQNKNNKNRIG